MHLSLTSLRQSTADQRTHRPLDDWCPASASSCRCHLRHRRDDVLHPVDRISEPAFQHALRSMTEARRRPSRTSKRCVAMVIALASLAACSSSATHTSTSTAGTTTSGAAVPPPSGIRTTTDAVSTASSSEPPTAASSPATDATTHDTVGIVAIGHSALTGENSDLTSPHRPVLENSWATGTAPAVNSIYLRLVAARPNTRDHVANTAVGGAVAASLPAQAQAALKTVPTPQLVIIETIDNDIRCDGTDDAHIPELGTSVAAALHVITSASPHTKILVVGQPGRPEAGYFQQLITERPELLQSFAGTGPCDIFDPSGATNAEHIQTLTDIIDRYEAEENRVCAQVPRCASDGGVRRQWVDHVDWYSPDGNHLNVTGLAQVSNQLWPVVQKLLDLA
jgi:hypothetical protein